MRRAAVLVALVAAGCAVDPPRDNPSDPKNPNASPGSVTGKVTLDATSLGLADVQITEVTVSVDGSADVTADTLGAFRVEGVKDGLHAIELRAPYHDPIRLEGIVVKAAQTTEVGAFQLARGRGEITGVVLIAGRIAPGCTAGVPPCGDHAQTLVTVTDHPASQPRAVFTNHEGAFALTGVAAGKRKLAVSHLGYDSAPFPNDVELQPKETKVLMPVTLGTGFSAKVSGRVLLEDVIAPSSAYTSIAVSLGGGVASTQADGDGGFLISSALGGEFPIFASKPGYDSVQSAPVRFEQNLTHVLAAPLRLRVSRGTIVGRVSVLGSSNDGAEICVEGQSRALCAISNGTGAFLISNVPTGLAQVVATKSAGGNDYVGRAMNAVMVIGDQPVDVGTINLSYVGGDFRLAGHVLNPTSGASVIDRNVTRDTWVGIELPPGVTTGYGFFKTNLAPTTWFPLPAVGPTDCSLPAQQTGNALCVQISANEGVNTVDLTMSELANGQGKTFGPLKGTIVYDISPPTNVKVVLNDGALFVNAAGGTMIALTVWAVDARSPLTAMRIAAASAAVPDLLAASTQGYNVTPGAVAIPDYATEGAKNVAVRVFDAAGNSADATAAITLDKTAPVGVTLSIVEANAALFVQKGQVTLDLGPGAVADLGRVRVANNSTFAGEQASQFVANTGANERRLWQLTPGDGVRQVFAIFEDKAGNPSPAVSVTVTVDSVSPAQPLVLLAENACTPVAPIDTKLNGTTQNTRLCVTIPLQAGERLDLLGCQATTSTAAIFDCDLSTTGDGLKQIQLVVVDPAGNRSTPAAAQVILDRTRPTVPTLVLKRSPGSTTAPGPKYVNSPVVVFDVGLGIDPDVAEVRLEQGAVIGPWTPLAGTGVLSLATTGDGPKAVSLRARDLAENESLGTSSDSVTLDQTLPLIPQVNMPARNANGFVQANAMLALNVTAPASLDTHFAALSIVGASSCAGGCTDGGPAFTIALRANEPSFIRVSAIDLAGNVGPEALLPVTHDDVLPTVPDLFDPQPTACFLPLEIYTSQQIQSVALRAGGTDLNFDSFEALVTADAVCSESDPLWARTSATNSFPLPLALGPNRLCIRAVDRAGNRSPSDSLRVIYDPVPPTTPTFGPDQRVNADSVYAYVTAPSTDASPVIYEVIGGPFGTWTRLPIGCTCASPTPTCAVNGRKFYEVPVLPDSDQQLFFRAVDAANNSSAAGAPVRVTEVSTWTLGGGAYLPKLGPRLEGDRVVWATDSVGAAGVYSFDLLRQDPSGGDVGVALALLPGPYLGVSHFGSLVTWSAANNISYCVINGAGVCGPVVSPGPINTINAEQYPNAVGDRIVYLDNTAPQQLRIFDINSPATTTLLAPGGVAGAGPIGRRVFDATTAFPANVAHGRVAWLSALVKDVVTGRTDGSAPVTLAAASSTSLGVWTDAHAVAWDMGSATNTNFSVVACKEPFVAGCSPSTLLGTGPWAGSRGFAVSAEPDGGFLVGTMADITRIQSPMLAASATSTVVHPIAGIGSLPSMQAGKLVYLNGQTRTTVDLWDPSSERPVDPFAIGARSPAVAGQTVAWLDPRFSGGTGGFDLMTADLDAGVQLRETPTSAQRAQLSISPPWAVWVEAGGPCGAPSCVVWRNLALNTTGRVGASDCGAFGASTCLPKVSAGKVVWTDFRGATTDVYLVDLAANPVSETVVANTGSADREAWISNDRVVWFEGSAQQRIMTRHFGVATGPCPAPPECLVGTSGCKVNLPPLQRGFPSVWVQPGAPCNAYVAWEEDSNTGSTRIGVFDWARNAARILDDDLRPTPVAARWGAAVRPVATSAWVAFEQARIATGVGISAGDVVRLYGWRSDAIGTVAVGGGRRNGSATDGLSVVYLHGQSAGVFDVRQYRPPRIP